MGYNWFSRNELCFRLYSAVSGVMNHRVIFLETHPAISYYFRLIKKCVSFIFLAGDSSSGKDNGFWFRHSPVQIWYPLPFLLQRHKQQSLTFISNNDEGMNEILFVLYLLSLIGWRTMLSADNTTSERVFCGIVSCPLADLPCVGTVYGNVRSVSSKSPLPPDNELSIGLL